MCFGTPAWMAAGTDAPLLRRGRPGCFPACRVSCGAYAREGACFETRFKPISFRAGAFWGRGWYVWRSRGVRVALRAVFVACASRAPCSGCVSRVVSCPLFYLFSAVVRRVAVLCCGVREVSGGGRKKRQGASSNYDVDTLRRESSTAKVGKSPETARETRGRPGAAGLPPPWLRCRPRPRCA